MTREDALMYLPYENEDDIKDIYQEKLFEFKQKVLNAVPSTRLYQIHLKKMALIHDAYICLTEVDNLKLTAEYKVNVNQNNLKTAWNSYNYNKNEIKLMLANANGFPDVHFLLGQLLENQRLFATIFEHLNFIQSKATIIGKDLDAMELEVEIERFMSRDYSDIKEIEKLDSTNILFQEANRLYLWLKREKSVR
jgi:hypothetical protein